MEAVFGLVIGPGESTDASPCSGHFRISVTPSVFRSVSQLIEDPLSSDLDVPYYDPKEVNFLIPHSSKVSKESFVFFPTGERSSSFVGP